MKALITAKTDNSLTLQLSDNTFTVGQVVYVLAKSTEDQRKTFHALLHEWIDSGCCSYDGDFLQVKNYVKRDYGAGFKQYLYAVNNTIYKVKTLQEIPEEIRAEPERVRGDLKSTTAYTMKEYHNLTSNLINNMIESGCNTKKFNEIMEELKQ
jgi:hypothetical protein